MSNRWRRPATRPWQIRHVLPRMERRDHVIAALLLVSFLLLVAVCPRIARTPVHFPDDGAAFRGRVVDKKLLMPPWRTVYPVKFGLVVDGTDGRQRLILVPFRMYTCAEPGTVVTRDGDGRLTVGGLRTASTR